MAADKTKIEVDGTKVLIWAIVDYETLKVLHVDATPVVRVLIHRYFYETCHNGAAVARCYGRTAALGTIGQ